MATFIDGLAPLGSVTRMAVISFTTYPVTTITLAQRATRQEIHAMTRDQSVAGFQRVNDTNMNLQTAVYRVNQMFHDEGRDEAVKVLITFATLPLSESEHEGVANSMDAITVQQDHTVFINIGRW